MNLKKTMFNLFQGFIFSAIFVFAASASPSSERYYLQLRYNHSSPFFNYTGIREINSVIAKRYPHYIFRYEGGRLSEIICNNPEYARTHHLTNIGAHRIVFEYDENREIRKFFNAEGKRCVNQRKVSTEIFEKNSSGMYTSLSFHDESGKPMQSEWNIARYTWEKKGDMIIEHRFDLNGTPVSISPYFPFMTTGIRFSGDGTYRETFNIDDNGMIKNSAGGIASYRDRYDTEGNHLEYAYLDEKGKPVLTPARYHKALKDYDDIGNLMSIKTYDIEGNLTKSQKFNSKRELNTKARIPDNKTFAGRNGVNLAIQYYEPAGITDKSPLLIYIHGRSEGGIVNLTKGKINLLDWLKNIGSENKAVTVFLQRPGFKSEIGKSEGFEDKDSSYFNAITAEHIKYSADAIRSLHEAYPQRPVILAGHSAGSRIAFSIAAYCPEIFSGLVLSAAHCPENHREKIRIKK